MIRRMTTIWSILDCRKFQTSVLLSDLTAFCWSLQKVVTSNFYSNFPELQVAQIALRVSIIKEAGSPSEFCNVG